MIKKFSPTQDLSSATLEDIKKSKRFFDLATVTGVTSISQSIVGYDELIFEIVSGSTLTLVLKSSGTAQTLTYTFFEVTTTNTVTYTSSAYTSVQISNANAKNVTLTVNKKLKSYSSVCATMNACGISSTSFDEVNINNLLVGNEVKIIGVKYV